MLVSTAVTGALVIGLSAGVASAKKEPTFTCSGLSGSILSTVNLNGCQGNTGGSGTVNAEAFATGSGTISWANGKTTTVTISSKSKKKEHGCPSTAYTEFKSKGKTTADSTTSAPPGSKLKSTICANLNSGAINSIGPFQI